MRILQINAGPNPDSARSNAYIDSLPPALGNLGHEVTVLNMVGVGGWLGAPSIATDPGSVGRITIVNSRAYAGLAPGGGETGNWNPKKDAIPSAALRKIVAQIARDLRPDIVHVQNLFGFPLQLVREFKALGLPVLFTAHDYFAICPTAHLFLRHTGQTCELNRSELVCNRCCATRLPYALFRLQLAFDRKIAALTPGSFQWRSVARVRNLFLRSAYAGLNFLNTGRRYQRRLDLMIGALHEFDSVQCISQLQLARLETTAGKLARGHVLPLVPPTVQRVGPVPRSRNESTEVRFCVLNVFPTREDKGWRFLSSAIESIAAECQNFHVDWYAESADQPRIRFRGRYRHEDLDRIAEESDFCIIPSLSLETLGFTGVEMLSRGVPLIVSNRCGVAEWVRHGETGLIFDPTNPAELRAAIKQVAADPLLVRRLREQQGMASTTMLTFADHVKAMSSLLGQVASRGSFAARK